ncbi:MAG: amidohydrolase family protein [Bryobacteraceae bacterium]|nr:amidohydrolase family protein [Solibacteraceae bacterium]MCO5350984.1 amidohydrolase family protein [Bryobacteraceae bacterium]
MTRALLLLAALSLPAAAQLAVRGETVYTMTGAPIQNGVVLVSANGAIERVGPASQVAIPAGMRTLSAKVVMPGLIDAHATAGLSGVLNQPHDQDQIERSAPIQPELRAIDAFNPRDELVTYLRNYGVTTLHTGHGPGALISGQTMIVKTWGNSVEDATVEPVSMIAASLGNLARAPSGAPGTRAKMIAMLRTELIKAREYAAKKEKTRDLRMEALVDVVEGNRPLLVTVHRANDILTALRLGKEFNLKLVLDGAAEAHAVLPEIKASGYPVIVHPTMARPGGDMENLTLEMAAKLKEAGIPFALQSGFEGYVPKTRVVLFEAALAAAHGLGKDSTLEALTIGAARLLGIDGRVGSLAPGKHADIALYDGDPLEYTTHCIAVIGQGQVLFEGAQ